MRLPGPAGVGTREGSGEGIQPREFRDTGACALLARDPWSAGLRARGPGGNRGCGRSQVSGAGGRLLPHCDGARSPQTLAQGAEPGPSFSSHNPILSQSCEERRIKQGPPVVSPAAHGSCGRASGWKGSSVEHRPGRGATWKAAPEKDQPSLC